MKACTRKKSKYNLCTLRPNNEEERSLFWDFRVEDIIEMFEYKFIYNVVLFLVFLLKFFDQDKDEDLSFRTMRRVVNLLLFFSVWLMTKTKKFRKCYIYWVPVVFVTTRFIAGLAAIHAYKTTDDFGEQRKIVEIEAVSFFADLILFIVVLTPSFSFIVFVYFPVFIAVVCYLRV